MVSFQSTGTTIRPLSVTRSRRPVVRSLDAKTLASDRLRKSGRNDSSGKSTPLDDHMSLPISLLSPWAGGAIIKSAAAGHSRSLGRIWPVESSVSRFGLPNTGPGSAAKIDIRKDVNSVVIVEQVPVSGEDSSLAAGVFRKWPQVREFHWA